MLAAIPLPDINMRAFYRYLRYHINRLLRRVQRITKPDEEFFVYVNNELTPVLTEDYFVIGDTYYDWGTVTKVTRYHPPKVKYSWKAKGIVIVNPPKMETP